MQSDYRLQFTNEVKLAVVGSEFRALIMRFAKKRALKDLYVYGLEP